MALRLLAGAPGCRGAGGWSRLLPRMRPGEASAEEGVLSLAPWGEQFRSATSELQRVTRRAFILQAFLVTEIHVITWPR